MSPCSLSSSCLLWREEFSNRIVLLILILMTLLMTTPGDCQSPLPYFISHPSGSLVKTGGVSHTIPCVLSSTAYNNEINIVWLFNNTPVVNQTYNQNENNLTIDSFSEDNNGNYACVAVTSQWTIRSNTALVQLTYLSSPYNGQSTSFSAKKFDWFTIDCIPEYSAHPMDQLEFEWQIVQSGETKISLSNSVNSPHENERLYIRRFLIKETYECRISSALDSTLSVSYTTTVTINGSIDSSEVGVIFIKPQDIVANVGDTVAFECVAGLGGNSALVTWTSSVNDISGSFYTINPVTKDDEGTYSCGLLGETETFSATLTVRDPPEFTTIIPSLTTITYGESRSLTCTVTGDDVQLLWYHNGMVVSTNNILYIDHADLSDDGAYQCFAISPAQNSMISNSTLVNVNTVPPSFLPNGTLYDQVVFTGGSLSLSCKATGAPQPSYYWLKDDKDPAVLNLDTNVPGLLTISSIMSIHNGKYTCVAETELGGVSIGNINTSAVITVIEPTMMIYNNPANLSSFIGDPFYLTCSVTHDPVKTTVQLSFTRDGQVIATNNIGETSFQLNITNASSSDAGQYQCKATTTYIQDNTLPVPTTLSPITVVDITDVPIKPVVTMVTAVGSTSLQVSWTYKGFIDNLKEYRLETQEVGNDRWNPRGIVLKTSVTVSNITGLQSYTQYNVRVVIVLISNGLSAASVGYGPIRTGQDVPSDAPPSSRIDVTMTNSTTGTVTLEWEAPDPSTVNGIISDYTIRYWLNGTVNITAVDVLVGSNATKYSLTQLIPNAVYWVRIAAHTAKGRGPFSAPVKLSTDPTIGNVSDDSEAVYTKMWFIVICAVAGLILIMALAVIIGLFRWKTTHKGNMYTVRHVNHSEEVSLTEDVVADYNRKRDKPMGFIESLDGSRSNIHHDTQIDYPSFGRADSFRGSMRESFRGSYRAGLHGPPVYINPPSFEETLKARLAKRRSASTTLLEKVEHTNFRGSGWSVGHDPKSSTAFFIPQAEPDIDSMIVKPSFSEPGEETSGESDTSTGFHSQSVTNVESFAQFV